MTEADDLFLQDLTNPELPTSEDIPQFDNANLVTEARKEYIITNAQANLDWLAHTDSKSYYPPQAEPLLYLLTVAPDVPRSDILSDEILSYLKKRAVDVTDENTQWIQLFRLLEPGKILANTHNLPSLTIDINNAIQAEDWATLLVHLERLAMHFPEKVNDYATEEIWQKVKANLEQRANLLQVWKTPDHTTSLFALNFYVQTIQLAFPGRVRELSFFSTLYDQLNQSLQKYKDSQFTDEATNIMYLAYYLTLLTSDGLEVEKSGGLRIVPHHTVTKTIPSSPPEEYI